MKGLFWVRELQLLYWAREVLPGIWRNGGHHPLRKVGVPQCAGGKHGIALGLEAKRHIGEACTSNSSHWYRVTLEDEELLIDDYSQDFQRFSKIKQMEELKFGVGPHVRYDEWREVKVHVKCDKTRGGWMPPS
jgi:hypothetical protein